MTALNKLLPCQVGRTAKTTGTIPERLTQLLLRCAPVKLDDFFQSLTDVVRLCDSLKEPSDGDSESIRKNGFKGIKKMEAILHEASKKPCEVLDSNRYKVDRNQDALSALFAQADHALKGFDSASDSLITRVLSRSLYDHVTALIFEHKTQAISDKLPTLGSSELPDRSTRPQQRGAYHAPVAHFPRHFAPPCPLIMPLPTHPYPIMMPFMGPGAPVMMPTYMFQVGFFPYGLPIMQGYAPRLPVHQTPYLSIQHQAPEIPQEGVKVEEIKDDSPADSGPSLADDIQELSGLMCNIPQNIRQNSEQLSAYLETVFPNTVLDPLFQNFDPSSEKRDQQVEVFELLMKGPFPSSFKTRLLKRVFVAVNLRSQTEGMPGCFKFQPFTKCITPDIFLELGDKAAWAMRSCLEINDYPIELRQSYEDFYLRLVATEPHELIETGYAKMTMLCNTFLLYDLHDETRKPIFASDAEYDKQSERKKLIGNVIRDVTEAIATLERGTSAYCAQREPNRLTKIIFPNIIKKIWGLLDIIEYFLDIRTTPTQKQKQAALAMQTNRQNLMQLLGNLDIILCNMDPDGETDYHPTFSFRIRYEPGTTAPTMIFSNLDTHRERRQGPIFRDDFRRRIETLQKWAEDIPVRELAPKKASTHVADTRDIDDLLKSLGESTGSDSKKKKKKKKEAASAESHADKKPHTPGGAQAATEIREVDDEEWARRVTKATRRDQGPRILQSDIRRLLVSDPEETVTLRPFESIFSGFEHETRSALETLNQCEKDIFPDLLTCHSGRYYPHPSLNEDDVFIKIVAVRRYVALLFRLAINVISKISNPNRNISKFDLDVLRKLEKAILLSELATTLHSEVHPEQQDFLDKTFSSDMHKQLTTLQTDLVETLADREQELADRRAFRTKHFKKIQSTDRPMPKPSVPSPETLNFRRVRSFVALVHPLSKKIEAAISKMPAPKKESKGATGGKTAKKKISASKKRHCARRKDSRAAKM